MYSSKFIKFGKKRERIPNIGDYLMNIYKKDPNITIAIGCDSAQKSKKTLYANTIVLYNHDIRNGASIIYYKESLPKIKDRFQRLYKEADYMNKIGTWLHNELEERGFVRNDIDALERKRYKFSQMLEEGTNLPLHEQGEFIKNIHLTGEEKIKKYKLVDIHLDLNPIEYSKDQKYNESYRVYKIAVPWLRGFDFRVYPKALSYAATSAADLLLK